MQTGSVKACTSAFQGKRCPLLVAVGGGRRLGERAEISARSSGVIAISSALSELSNWVRLRAPMMGAVIAGWLPTQATARAAGSKPRSAAKAVKRSATSYTHSAP